MKREEVEQMAQRLAKKPASEATYLEHVAALALQASIAKSGGKLSPIAHAGYAVQAANVLVAKLAASTKSPLNHFADIPQLMHPDIVGEPSPSTIA